MYVGANSSLGPIAEVDYNVYFHNNRTGEQGNLSYTDYPGNSSWYRFIENVFTDTGDVYVELSGDVILGNGDACTIMNPSDETMIG